MTTKCYYLSNTPNCGWVLADIANRIPCFMEFNEATLLDEVVEVTIVCRDADLPFVERSLGEFV